MLPPRPSLEFQVTHLATLRHHIENFLADYCTALEAADTTMLAQTLHGVRASINGKEYSQPAEGLDRLHELFGLDKEQGTAWTMTNIRVNTEGHHAFYSATLQAWALDFPAVCLGIISCTGQLTAGAQAWDWNQHRLRTRTAPCEAESTNSGTRGLLDQSPDENRANALLR